MNAPYTYVALGDSTGVGVGSLDRRGYVARVYERLVRRDPTARLVNLCASGATSATVRDQQLARALRAAPDLATVFIGGNDVWRGVSPRRFGENLDAVAGALARSGARVIVGTVANLAHAPVAAFAEHLVGIAPAAIERRVGELNAEVRRVARAHGLVTVDLAAVGLADAPHYFSMDGFHPSDAGYEAWAELLWPAIARARDAHGRAPGADPASRARDDGQRHGPR